MTQGRPAITWTGFDNFYYLFSHEDSRDSFAIPHDLRILKEVFTLDPGGYNAENAYWKSFSLRRLARGWEAQARQAFLAAHDAAAAEPATNETADSAPTLRPRGRVRWPGPRWPR